MSLMSRLILALNAFFGGCNFVLWMSGHNTPWFTGGMAMVGIVVTILYVVAPPGMSEVRSQ
jgi:hypothetical protein